MKVRATNPLFKSSNPSAHPNGFLADINPESEEIFPNAMIEVGFEEIRSRAPWPAEAGEKSLTSSGEDVTQMSGDETRSKQQIDMQRPRPETIRFQGMRMGYFCVDKDTNGDNIMLNRIVTLKEDAGKG